jgi:Ca2+-binding RTX toxin-like protein
LGTDQQKETDMAIWFGTSGDDLRHGSNDSDYLSGEAGDDTLFGNGDNDTVLGGLGEDHLQGNDGNDSVYGGADDDVIDGGIGNDRLHGDVLSPGADGDDVVRGRDGNDTIYGDGGDDFLFGHNGSDSIYGGPGNDLLHSGYEDNYASDRLDGGWGNDTLISGRGIETLIGGLGNDVLIDGFEQKFMRGDAGADVFEFNHTAGINLGVYSDYILDFSHAQGDKIDLVSIDANILAAGNQKFTFIGEAGFTGTPGELRYEQDTSGFFDTTTVMGSVDGRGAAFELVLLGLHDPGASDFVL